MEKKSLTRYVSQNEKGMWKVSVTKSGDAEKVYPTQKEAILYAETINGVETVFVKRSSGWEKAYTFNKETQKLAKTEVEKLRNVEADETAKNDVVEEIIHGSVAPSVQKETRNVANETKENNNMTTNTKTDAKWSKLGKFVFIFAIISGIASLAMTIAAMVQTVPSQTGVELSIWSMAAQPTGISAIDDFAKMATYGIIAGLVVGLAGIGIAIWQFKKINNGEGTSLLWIVVVIFLAMAADAITAAGIGTAMIVTDPAYLADYGQVFLPKN